MHNDLDSKEISIRSRNYMVENPNKILKLDPDQGGSSRGMTASLPDSAKRPKQEDTGENDPDPKPEQEASVLPEITDTVSLSPQAIQAAPGDQPQSPPAVAEPEPDPPPPAVHINITA